MLWSCSCSAQVPILIYFESSSSFTGTAVFDSGHAVIKIPLPKALFPEENCPPDREMVMAPARRACQNPSVTGVTSTGRVLKGRCLSVQ